MAKGKKKQARRTATNHVPKDSPSPGRKKMDQGIQDSMQ